MSQRDLAKAFQLIGCDIDQNVITRIETGKRKVTDMEIWAISIVFGVKAGELFDPGELEKVRALHGPFFMFDYFFFSTFFLFPSLSII